jgi:2-polyprenyl-6-methoxyphenol hydroxylase-like FAD-dependent oxidoreductase
VVLDQDDKLSDGSRAICIQRPTLEIFRRLGAVEPMMAKGVTWTLGRVFWRRYNAAAYTGDAQLEEWFATLESLRERRADQLVPGRGPALQTPEDVNAALNYTRDL